jgi:GDPmannose 4,6-dehydratase
VIATGTSRSVKEFAKAAFKVVGLEFEEFYRYDARFYRASEATPLIGDASKAKRLLGWEPKKNFEEMIAEMVHSDREEFHLPEGHPK